MQNRTTYIAIDLKSFYASVECVSRGLNPLTTNLVVADATRTDKTICLAVTPSLKNYGIKGRPRLFEVIQIVRQINALRIAKTATRSFIGGSFDIEGLELNPNLKFDYIIAKPRMSEYIKKSTDIFNIYLKFFSKEDIYAYSVDEVFIDATKYLEIYELTARNLARLILNDIFDITGLTATVGIGSNMYLAKIAMDIVAKKLPADKNGARIAELDELSYRKLLWNHRPLTDFWKIGKGYARALEEHGLLTMGDVARCSLGSSEGYHNEKLLYRLFGINAELLMDHAWGYENCSIKLIKSYVPKSTSLSRGQVLDRPYKFSEGLLVVQEMMDLLALELVARGLVTNQLVLYISYDVENISWNYVGKVVVDSYGRKKPIGAHGLKNLGEYCSSTFVLVNSITELYQEIVDKGLLVRKVSIVANNIQYENVFMEKLEPKQLCLFSESKEEIKLREDRLVKQRKEKSWQQAINYIHNRYGKNSLLKGINYLEGAKTRERNEQIGGHKA